MTRLSHGTILAAFFIASIHAQDAYRAAFTLDRKAQIEADWIRQAEVRNLKPMSPADDAAGGVDGIKTGKWDLHTGMHRTPWWQVDLQQPFALDRVVIYNRADSPGVAARLGKFLLLISQDGKKWDQVYQHDGAVFLGAPDNKPLAVPLNGVEARFVRIQSPVEGYLHLDEVEVYGVADKAKNIALWKPADQCSLSTWSRRHDRPGAEVDYPIEDVIERGLKLAADRREAGVDVSAQVQELERIASAIQNPQSAIHNRKSLYLQARWAVRKMAFANPLLDFDALFFVKRAPASFSHMSDQYYGWWSRPGGGLFVLDGWKTDSPTLRAIPAGLPEGSCLRPDLSYDAKKILFSFCKYYPNLAGEKDKVDKSRIPEDAFYHIYEINVDGTGLRRLTHGKYDDFDARYLPNGEIVFLSTRRGQFIQCGKNSAMSTLTETALPDSYVRCGGGNSRPVAVYTLHVMDADGGNIRAISPFENFEWTPSVAHDGRVLFARWDYIDRSNMPYMSLWATNPDGTNLQAVYGNFTRSPHCIFETRCIPNSRKMIFTASAHHCITGGSLVLLDANRGLEEGDPITRLTPEVIFPESEGWPETFYANPYPLSEKYFLTAWSDLPLRSQGRDNAINALGLYLYDAFGNLELVYRDPDIGSECPIPLRPCPRPPIPSSDVAWDAEQEGRFLLMNVYEGLPDVKPKAVKRIRIVGVPAKTQPQMNSPNLGVTRDDPGKFVIGTVPVEADGSAHFRLPSGVLVFFQALDADGLAIQTMRTATYMQAGQTVTCIGCHEPRNAAPPNALPKAALRGPSNITPGPEGSWPMRFDQLVQPVLDKHCVECHQPGYKDAKAAKFDLTPAKAYDSLIAYGKPSLSDHVRTRYGQGKSTVGAGAAQESQLLSLIRKGHYDVKLDTDGFERLVTWMDIYAQRQGSFSEDQEQRLRQLRLKVAHLLSK
ncbi:MAG: discoidin domain-containing protein [Planctomycetota bacterium]